jgi:hypothetical protein
MSCLQTAPSALHWGYGGSDLDSDPLIAEESIRLEMIIADSARHGAIRKRSTFANSVDRKFMRCHQCGAMPEKEAVHLQGVHRFFSSSKTTNHSFQPSSATLAQLQDSSQVGCILAERRLRQFRLQRVEPFERRTCRSFTKPLQAQPHSRRARSRGRLAMLSGRPLGR